ncbi:MAG: hypothetical protein V7K77_21315 [Nostoc sp.]
MSELWNCEDEGAGEAALLYERLRQRLRSVTEEQGKQGKKNY